MYVCLDKKEFFRSRIREPRKRKGLIQEFLKERPWKEIFKKETSLDSDDEDCTIVKAFLQDDDPQESERPESPDLDKRMECWHALKELAGVVPELSCVLRDVHVGSQDELHETSKSAFFESESKADTKGATLTAKNYSFENLKNVRPLSEVLYSNEAFSKILDGIVYKEILQLIDSNETIDFPTSKFNFAKKRTVAEYIETKFLISELVEEEEEEEGDKINEEIFEEEMKPEYENVEDDATYSQKSEGFLSQEPSERIPKEQKPQILEKKVTEDPSRVLSIQPGVGKSTTTNLSLSTRFKSQPSPSRRASSQRSADQKVVSQTSLGRTDSSEYDSLLESDSEDLSDPDELFRELLGNINYQEVLEEWKMQKELKEQQKIQAAEQSKLEQKPEEK